ncbi:MAG: helix-turn-helix domain-containing protein [Thermomicrobiales bacterium]
MPKKVSDLIRVTGLDKHTIYAGIQRGELPGYKIGGSYTIPDEAFEDFLRGRWSPTPRPV